MKPIFYLLMAMSISLLHGAASDKHGLHIFNASPHSPFLIQLYANECTRIALKPLSSEETSLAYDLFKLPPRTCVKVSHNIEQAGRLRLRVWPEQSLFREGGASLGRSSFKKKIIQSRCSAIIIMHLSEFHDNFIETFSKKGYSLEEQCIPRKLHTLCNENLIAFFTSYADETIFKDDLQDAIAAAHPNAIADSDECFKTINTLRAPVHMDIDRTKTSHDVFGKTAI